MTSSLKSAQHLKRLRTTGFKPIRGDKIHMRCQRALRLAQQEEELYAARGEATVTANQQAASVYQTLGVAEQAAFRRGAREAALRIMNARLWAYEAQQICQEYADPQPEETEP